MALDIVIGTNPGVVEGRVARERDGTADLSVVLVPDVRGRSELFRSMPADASGRFRFDRVPPGEYKVFAWADVQDEAWYDGDFLRSSESRGVPVRVGEGLVEALVVPAISLP